MRYEASVLLPALYLFWRQGQPRLVKLLTSCFSLWSASITDVHYHLQLFFCGKACVDRHVQLVYPLPFLQSSELTTELQVQSTWQEHVFRILACELSPSTNAKLF